MSLQVSVVVPTYKRPELLKNCLKALLNQDFPPDDYEIIVVDDAGSEKTRSQVAYVSGPPGQRVAIGGSGDEAGGHPAIYYAPAAHTKGPAAARNIGWRLARGEIIAFTDDDCLPEPDWLKEGVAALGQGNDVVTGQVVVPVYAPPTDYQKNVSKLMTHAEFLTANCFVRRCALEACGGFDERFTMAWREDSDLQFRLMELTYKLGRAPGARVLHPARPAPWGVSLKEQRKSMFNALLFKKYPTLYRQRIQARPPLRYYAIVLSILGFLLALALGLRQVAALMALLWAGLTLQFAFQRLKGTKLSPSHIIEMLWTSMLIPPLSVFWRLYGAIYYRVLFF